MECLQIDWAEINDSFERDEFYESIQAPRWLDFTAPMQPVDDHAWFCGNAGCGTHVREAETATPVQESMAAPSIEKATRGAACKRARNAISSSYSSALCIKEAFTQRKVLHLAKGPCPPQTKGHTLKEPMQQHASENKNPNQITQVQPADYRVPGSRIPILKGHGKEPSQVSKAVNVSILSEQASHSQSRHVLLTKLGKPPRQKDAVQRNAATKNAEKDNVTNSCNTLDPNVREDEVIRAPVSMYMTQVPMSIKNSQLTSSVVIPSTRSAAVTRSLQYDLLNPKKSKQPTLVAGKEHAGAVSVRAQGGVSGKQMKSMVCGSSLTMEKKLRKVKQGLRVPDQQIQKSMDDGEAVSGQPMLKEVVLNPEDQSVEPIDNPPHQFCHEEEHALEKHLENLHLSMPSESQAARTRIAEKDSAADQKSTFEVMMARSGDIQERQRNTNRGLKRKSSELNFKVNCYSRDHGLDRQKVTMGEAPLRSLMSHEMKHWSTRVAPIALSCHGLLLDSCKEQHKRIKTTEAQAFKPFRLRTEERAALKELGLGKKEQRGAPGLVAQELMIHHALKMPSFTHTFRPQRSTKKLTVPKEPNFHTSRARKTCTRLDGTKLVVSSS